jgi:hypothetical protein
MVGIVLQNGARADRLDEILERDIFLHHLLLSMLGKAKGTSGDLFAQAFIDAIPISIVQIVLISKSTEMIPGENPCGRGSSFPQRWCLDVWPSGCAILPRS